MVIVLSVGVIFTLCIPAADLRVFIGLCGFWMFSSGSLSVPCVWKVFTAPAFPCMLSEISELCKFRGLRLSLSWAEQTGSDNSSQRMAVGCELVPGSSRADHYFLIKQKTWSPLCRSVLLWHFRGKNSLIAELRAVHPHYSQLYL